MRKLSFILLLFSCALSAQQFSMPAQIDRNLLYVNPAYAGKPGAAVVHLMHRTQWINVPGAPTFQSFEFHAPLKKQAVALGLQARRETVGNKNNNEAFFTYTHRIRLAQSTLAFGLKGGINSVSYTQASLENTSTFDPAYETNSLLLPNAGFGIGYYSKKFYAGLAIPYFFGTKATSDGTAEMDFDMSRLVYLFTAGGSFPVSEVLKIEPSLAVNYSSNLEPAMMAQVNFRLIEHILFGGGYRMDEALLFNLAYGINKQFSVAYSYEHTLGKLGAFSSGSHELGLMYYFGFVANTVNPRDF